MPQIPDTMMAVVTRGIGGYDQLDYTRIDTPKPSAGQVLIKVLAAGMNNTEINTRLGWYSRSVSEGTDGADTDATKSKAKDGGWNGTTGWPLIQGTDCCGEVVAVGPNTPDDLIGRRVLVRACMRPNGYDEPEQIWLGSNCDGAFAEYMTIGIDHALPVDCDWTDAELATLPCAYGTAENMLHLIDLQEGDHVLIPGASGGVASAAIQLAKRRGARVTAVTSESKVDAIKALGADQVVTRGTNLIKACGENTFDAVVDNVGGADFGQLLKVIRPFGRYITSGAIAGPIVDLDLRDLYLKDLSLLGSTGWDEEIFPNLVSYVENDEIRPLLANTYPLDQIANAQEAFLKKAHIGNFVLLPAHAE